MSLSKLLSAVSLVLALSVILSTRERWRDLHTTPQRDLRVVLPTCPSQPTLHYTRENNEEIHSDYMNKQRLWHDGHSKRFTEYPRKENLFTTLKNGNFILWKISMKGESEMSAYNDELVLEKKVSGPGPFRWNYISPESKDVRSIRNIQILEGDYVAFIAPFPGNYAHFILDHLPFMAYLRHSFPSHTKFLLADHFLENRQWIQELDPAFNNRIKWVRCTGRYECYQKFIIQNGSLTVVTDSVFSRHLLFVRLARSWMFNRYKPNVPIPLKTIVYYTRNSKNVYNSRQLDSEHENQILERIERAMKRHNRPERLAIFRGNEAFHQQIALFRSATVVIGPHGGGLANLIWTLPPEHCGERPKVLEFLNGPETKEVYPGLMDYSKTYHRLLSSCPWIEYHHVLFREPSTQKRLFVDLGDLDEALDAMLSSPKQEELV